MSAEPELGARAAAAAPRTCAQGAGVRWAVFLYRALVLLLAFIILGYVVQDHHSAVLTRVHREAPRRMLLALAEPEGSTLNASCFPHLVFGAGSNALGMLCLNPVNGRVAWDLQVRDPAFLPPLSHLAVHGPVPPSEDARSAPVFLRLDGGSSIAGEQIVAGMLPLPAHAVAQVLSAPRDYYVEMRPHRAEGGAVTPAPLRSPLA